MRIDAHMTRCNLDVRSVGLPSTAASDVRRNVAADVPRQAMAGHQRQAEARRPPLARDTVCAQTGYFFGFSTGYPALTQSANIMSAEVTLVKPSSISVLVASAQRPPDAQ